jgi:putative transposase
MPNHVHLILVPAHPEGLRAALAEAHRRYSRAINFREGWRGYLWQGRFASCPMDDRHTLAAARYIELNPVRAHLASRPEDWLWSSAPAPLGGGAAGITDLNALRQPVGDWAQFLAAGLDDATIEVIRGGERTGRPLGDEAFVKQLEASTGRHLARQRPGPKPAQQNWV